MKNCTKCGQLFEVSDVYEKHKFLFDCVESDADVTLTEAEERIYFMLLCPNCC